MEETWMISWSHLKSTYLTFSVFSVNILFPVQLGVEEVHSKDKLSSCPWFEWLHTVSLGQSCLRALQRQNQYSDSTQLLADV